MTNEKATPTEIAEAFIDIASYFIAGPFGKEFQATRKDLFIEKVRVVRDAHDRLQREHEKVGDFGDVFEDRIGNVASANQREREGALDALWDAWSAVKEVRGDD